MSDLHIAVIGLAGRFPGARNAAEFWRNIADGVESLTQLSDEELLLAGVDRAMLDNPRYVKVASVLEGADLFDAAFFGYSPREAALIDPQGRVFLECAWEGLEDAGYFPDTYHGTIGVWASQSTSTYLIHNLRGKLDFRDCILGGQNIHPLIGNGADFLATRVSYRLNLQGPAVDVQTACSSSLVAIHLARQSLLNDECDIALAGASSIYLPQRMGYLHQDGLILSPDGHCRPFDAEASGTIFGRGAGVVVLKRLEDAVADGDNIRAVIRGSAVNNDGSRKVGYTAPSVQGQARVIAEALADADVSAAGITYVEAHGTGTPSGDPIEITALTRAFRRSADGVGYCAIGAVKSNIGHLDAASGVTGFIKVVQMLEHRQIPPSLNFRQPNPQIDFESSPFRVSTQLSDWAVPEGDLRRAGISSFGIGGTNAHMILEEAPKQSRLDRSADRPVHLIGLSGRSDRALCDLTELYTQELSQRDEGDTADVCFTANTGRARFSERLVVAGSSTAELSARMEGVTRGESVAGAWRGSVDMNAEAPKVAFLFTGQGAQYGRMGRDLYRTQPTFKRVMDECNEILGAHLDHPLLEVLYGTEDSAVLLNETAYTQPALFSLEYGLAVMWRSWGIEPSVVMGHSLGEYTAACVAGVFGLEDGLRLVTERGRLMASVPSGGMMAVVFADHDAVLAQLSSLPDVTVAALNGPSNVVISGPRAAVESVLEAFLQNGVESRPLAISNGFHSPQVEPILDSFEAVVQSVRLSEPQVPIVSNLTGSLVQPGEVTRSQYWRNHLRQPVLFRQAIGTLLGEGVTDFLEVGPHPTLLAMARECVPPDFGHWHPSLRRDRDDWDQIAETVAALYLRGASVDWKGFDLGYDRRRVPLPTYPFERKRHWIEPGPVQGAGPGESSGTLHPFIRRRVRSPVIKETVFECRVGPSTASSLDDHRILGEPIFPATGYLELALAASRIGFGDHLRSVRDVMITKPLPLSADGERGFQIILRSQASGDVSWVVFSAQEGGGGGETNWVRHAEGRVSRDDVEPDAPNWNEIRRRCPREVSTSDYYDLLAQSGLEYGQTFQGIRRLWKGDGEALGIIEAPADVVGEAESYLAHPAVLDACLQVSMSLFSDFDGGKHGAPFLPVGLSQCWVKGPFTGRLWSHARAKEGNADSVGRQCDIVVCDGEGRTVAYFTGILFRQVDLDDWKKGESKDVTDWFYEVEWRPSPILHVPESEQVVRMPGPGDLAPLLGERLEQLRTAHGMATYDGIQRELDQLSTDYATAALRELGYTHKEGQVSIDALQQELGVVPRQERMFVRLLEIFEEDKMLVQRNGAVSFNGLLPEVDPQSRISELRARTPSDLEPMWSMVERCGGNMAAVLRGARDPLELLFPGGSVSDLEALYQQSPFAQVYNGVLQEALRNLVGKLPVGAKLRVLEIGAGTGGTTAALLPILQSCCEEYVYTDVSHLFLSRAKEKFREFPFIRYEIFDVEEVPERQGISRESFDIVVASNVLHATSDLRRTLQNVRCTMADGGVLLLVEGIARQRWVDLIFGLTDGWWKFRDTELRSSYPLIPQRAWKTLLATTGFEDVASLPEDNESRAIFGQAVILAQVSSRREGDRESTATSNRRDKKRWLVFAGHDDTACQLVSALRQREDECEVVLPAKGPAGAGDGNRSLAPGVPEGFRALLSSEGDGELPRSPYHGVLYLWGLDREQLQEPGLRELDATVNREVAGLLHLVQAMVGANGFDHTRLWIVTRGAKQAGVGDPVPSPFHSPLWGLGQVVSLEHPELRCTRVDLDPQSSADDVEALIEELDAPYGEDQIAFRNAERKVARLVPAPTGEASIDEMGAADLGREPYRLASPEPGSLDNLQLAPMERRTPGSGEVEIRVASTGLNFRDVLLALGMYPDSVPLGCECAGTVAAVGADVHRFRLGDPVIAFAIGSFSTFVTTSAELVVRKPPTWTFDQAATTVVSFLTADVALFQSAKIKSGDRVLIHSGAGGVGMAAIQMACAVGAEVFATAGSPEKREFLRTLGVAHVMDSRSLRFGDDVLAATDGHGVNVVVNCLAGAFIDESMRVTARGGRFVEMGKNGIWPPEKVAALNRDISYHVIDVAESCLAKPGGMGARLRSLMERFESGELRQLPARVFDIDDVQDAFRYMAQAKHIGKVVVRHKSETACRSSLDAMQSSNGTYLIVGGLGGLGILVARWMVERGARHLVLMGRSEPSAEARKAIDEMEAAGATITVERADVTIAEEVNAVLGRIDETEYPLCGLIQGAGVLDDGVLLQQTAERFARVMRVKVQGSWILHQLTAHRNLDSFVMFSSVASVLGSPGQGNHSAANSFLDSLAGYRRARGLAALSINWGAWSEVGAASERTLQARLSARGLGAISPSQGLKALEISLEQDRPQVTVVAADWAKFPPAPLVDDLVRQPAAETVERPIQRQSWSTRLANAPVGQERAMLSAFVKDRVAHGLGLDADDPIDPMRPLSELGLDSLLAVELRNSLASGLETDGVLPATLLFDHPSLDGLTEYLAREVLGLVDSNVADTVAVSRDSDVDDISALSDEEAEVMLLKELDRTN